MTSAPAPLSVSDIIDHRPVGRLQIQLTVLCSLVLLLDGADTIVIGLVGQGMAHTVGVPVAALGSVFSIGQFGFFFGALAFGPFGDRLGRKPVLVGSVLLFGAATILTTLAHSVSVLLLFRFITGLGLGGAAPVAVSLVAEYMPVRIRATLISLSWAAFPLGGAVISLASTVLLAHGWQFLFALLGGLSVVLSLLLILAVPESLGFLAAKQSAQRRLDKILSLLKVEQPAGGLVTESKQQRLPVKTLFVGGRALQTPLLWVAFFCSFLPLIYVTNWAPTILHQHGITTAEIGVAIALNSIGSAIGSGSVGRAMDRIGSHYVVVVMLAAAAVSLVALGVVVGGFTGVAIAITAAGVFAGAGQTGIITLGSLLYPTLLRSTALGWAMAMGRLGAATAPLLGAAMIAAKSGPVGIFAAAAAFPVVALACLVLIRAFTDTRLPQETDRMVSPATPTG